MERSHLAGARSARSATQRLAILLFAILQVLVTLLPSLGIGESIGDRSDDVRTAITPAGWAFSIWGLLYTGSFVYAIYQLLPEQQHSALLQKVGWASAGAFLGNTLWALYVQFGDVDAGSAIIIAFTLFCLIVCYWCFSNPPLPLSRGEKYLTAFPLSALAAWLTAATIVNIAASLRFHGLDLGGATLIAGALVVLAGGIISAVTITAGYGNPWYTLLFLWALAGIYSANAGANTLILGATIVSAIIVAGTALSRLRQPNNRSHWF